MATAEPTPRDRVLEEFSLCAVLLCEADPVLDDILQIRERFAALMYQLGMFPVPPDPDVEHDLAVRGLLLRRSEISPEDAAIVAEIEMEDWNDGE